MVSRRTRTGDRMSKSTSSEVGIKLGIKGEIPSRPVSEAQKIAASEGLEATFFFSHVRSLKTIEVKFFSGKIRDEAGENKGTIIRIEGKQRGDRGRSRRGRKSRFRRISLSIMKLAHGKDFSVIRVGTNVILQSNVVITSRAIMTRNSIKGSNVSKAVKL
jgi:hypothetical protein